MPVYSIFHAVPLSDQQQDDLAEAITTLHTTTFKVLSLFVNVEFSDVRQRNTYIGGKRRKGNHIRAAVRLGQRTTQDFSNLGQRIEEAWDRIVTQPAKQSTRGDAHKFKLDTMVIGPVNAIGREAGFELPLAGDDEDWIKQNWSTFQQKAEEGEEEFVDLVKEVKERGLLRT